jgi:hypothetical protein
MIDIGIGTRKFTSPYPGTEINFFYILQSILKVSGVHLNFFSKLALKSRL